MGFNYLQTDDREDDYFASLGKKKKFPFALYADPSRKVYAFNKKMAAKMLGVDPNLIGSTDRNGKWLKNKSKPMVNNAHRPKLRQIKSME